MIDGDDRAPDGCAVAVLAHIRGLRVSRALARCVRAVVAADAVARDVGMIEIGRDPRVGGVAVVAGVAARDVRRVLPGGDRAVMAGETGSDDLQMINHVGRRPDDVVMAVLTDVGRIDVVRPLACRLGAVVAAEAVTRDIHMIEIRRDPRVGGVAIVTVVAARDVRRVFPGGDRAVVTGNAGTNDLDVVHCVGRRPDDVVVAVLADVGRVYVIRTFTSGRRAVVTGDAAVDDVCVIEVRRHPGRRRMTVVAVVAARNVRRVLARGG